MTKDSYNTLHVLEIDEKEVKLVSRMPWLWALLYVKHSWITQLPEYRWNVWNAVSLRKLCASKKNVFPVKKDHRSFRPNFCSCEKESLKKVLSITLLSFNSSPPSSYVRCSNIYCIKNFLYHLTSACSPNREGLHAFAGCYYQKNNNNNKMKLGERGFKNLGNHIGCSIH